MHRSRIYENFSLSRSWIITKKDAAS